MGKQTNVIWLDDFESYWWQIFLQKRLKYLVTFWAVVKTSILSETAMISFLAPFV